MLKEKAKSCLGRTSEKIGVLAFKQSKKTEKFYLKRRKRYRQHSARIDCPFEGSLQHHHRVNVMEGVQHKHFLLEQCHKHKGSTVIVIKSPYLNTPQLLDGDR